jgi:hypothetical protein
MWVWVAMRCFFEVDCTSSILIAATSPAAAGYALSVFSRAALPPQQIWERAREGNAAATGLLWKTRCRLEWEQRGGWAGRPGCYNL